MDSDFGEFGVFFFKALKSYSQCYRKKVTHAGDQRSVSPNFVCNMGRCWRFFARSTRFDLKAPPEADALKMWKNRALLCVSQNEEQESRYIKIRKKKTAACFSPWCFIDFSRFGCSNGSIWRPCECATAMAFFLGQKGCRILRSSFPPDPPGCPGNHGLNQKIP